MHDLNLTAMFAPHVLLLRDGRVLADAVLTDAVLAAAYGCALRGCTAPAQGGWLLPQATG
ncbi:MAG: hypothetical protein MEQ74_06475 [Paracoccus sp.]|nr:hypothetical protein [Paracoccus sp. (in: a-proteobacteria)]